MKRASLLATLSALRTAQDRVSAVEFALVSAALVVPLVLGGYDIGSALYRWMEVGNAARAGAAYATYCGCFNETNIVAAVGNATTLASIVPNSSQGTPSPAPTQFCGCPSATSGITATANTPPACGSTQCSSGGFDGTYVKVNAQVVFVHRDGALPLEHHADRARLQPELKDDRAGLTIGAGVIVRPAGEGKPRCEQCVASLAPLAERGSG